MVRWSRHRAGVWLVAVTLAAWFICTFLLAPATTFAAAASTNDKSYSSSACGARGGAPLMVMTSSSGASIWLNHTTGPVGTPLVISGAGWPAATTVTIDAYSDTGAGQAVLGQEALARARTFADGTFQTAPFPAPAGSGCGMATTYGAPGSVVLFRAHIGGNRVSAEARFTYLATPSFSPPDLYLGSGVMPGSVVPLSGQNWGPDQWITVTTAVTYGQTQEELDNIGMAQSSGSAPIQVRANANGTFTTQVVVPTDIPPAPSSYDAFAAFVVSVSATDPRYGTFSPAPLVFTIQPENAPTFTANLTQGLPGTIVTLTGTNWPSSLVLLDYCRGQVQAPGTSHVGCYNAAQGIGFAVPYDPSGLASTFSVEVTIPTDARPGLITLQASIDSDVLPNIYTLDLPFDILTPSSPVVPWQLVHPRLAEALLVGDVVVPVILLMCGSAGAAVLLRRRRQSRAQQVG